MILSIIPGRILATKATAQAGASVGALVEVKVKAPSFIMAMDPALSTVKTTYSGDTAGATNAPPAAAGAPVPVAAMATV